MPTRYRIALGCLYAVVFSFFAMMCLGIRTIEWALTEFGLGPTLTGFAIWVALIVGSIRLINKINEDWPALSLPPEPVYSPELPAESVLLSTQIDVRSVAARPAQYPGYEKAERSAERC
jgi:hypothetical protein